MLAKLQILAQPLPKCPVEVGTLPHWLAIGGKQPTTAENAVIDRRKPAAKRTRAAASLDNTSAGMCCRQDVADFVHYCRRSHSMHIVPADAHVLDNPLTEWVGGRGAIYSWLAIGAAEEGALHKTCLPKEC